jgi:PAS domain S-box-containing protein
VFTRAGKGRKSTLHDIEEHYRHSFELSPHIPWTAAADGLIVEIGPQWLSLVGMPRQDALGAGWIQALHSDDVAVTTERWLHSLQTGSPVDVEYRLRLVSGDYRWFRARAAARRDEQGCILRWYGTVEDIQERKFAEEALRESSAFAGSILDNSPDCIKVLDLDGRLLFMNEPGLQIMEISDFPLLQGRFWGELWPASAVPLVRQALQEAAAGRTGHFSASCPTARGTPKWWDVLVSPIRGPDGQPLRILSVSRDVTRAKQVQEEAEQARRETQAAAQRFEAVLESTTDSVILLDQDWRITYVNQHAATLLRQRGLSLGANLWEAFPEEVGGIFDRHYRRAMAEQLPVVFEAYLSSPGLWLAVHAYPTTEGGCPCSSAISRSSVRRSRNDGGPRSGSPIWRGMMR